MRRATEPRPSRQTAWAIGLTLVLHGILLTVWRAPAAPAPPPSHSAPIVMQAQWLPEAPKASPPTPLNPPGKADGTAKSTQRARAPITRAPAMQMEASTLSTQDPAPTRSTPPRPVPETVSPTAPPQPLQLSPEALASSLQRERRWQHQHGDGRRFPDRFEAPRPGDSPGTASLQEGAPGPGGRLARVQGPLGTYCVRLPPPDRPLPEGPAPRLALPSNCP